MNTVSRENGRVALFKSGQKLVEKAIWMSFKGEEWVW